MIPVDENFSPKSGKSRDMPYFCTTKELIEPYRRNSGYICCPDKSSGKHYRWNNSAAFTTLLRRAELTHVAPYGHIQKVTPHVLRHSWASHLLKNGASFAQLMEWGGWNDYTSVRIYSHLIHSEADEHLL